MFWWYRTKDLDPRPAVLHSAQVLGSPSWTNLQRRDPSRESVNTQKRRRAAKLTMLFRFYPTAARFRQRLGPQPRRSVSRRGHTSLMTASFHTEEARAHCARERAGRAHGPQHFKSMRRARTCSDVNAFLLAPWTRPRAQRGRGKEVNELKAEKLCNLLHCCFFDLHGDETTTYKIINI